MRRILVLLMLLPMHAWVFAQQHDGLSQQVEIRRTAYGVPHIRGANLEAVTFGLAWCELEDYGERVVRPLIAARGELAKVDGYEAIDSDFINQLAYRRTLATYMRLDEDTRSMLSGFAKGVNAYLRRYPERLPRYQGWVFSGADVAATSNFVATSYSGRSFVDRLKRQKEIRDSLALTEAGSNAWALTPSRSKSGHAMLVRNPHLSWNAGYYEAHLTVEGKLNFYGDFRIGGLFGIIGGFNERLGWATTNNHPDLEEVYALEADAQRPDHYVLDGIAYPLERRILSVEFRHGHASGIERREMLFTPYGPVIHREEGNIYVWKQAGDGEFRRGQQFVHMMLARNLEEWKTAMRMQAITASNYTYADADGNIFYVWNATTPVLAHPSGGDTAAVSVTHAADIWSRVVPFDSLPQLLNPPGGYLHNENDPFHFTNLQAVMRPEDYPANFPRPRLRQRSQHSLQLIANEQQFSLEEVVALKHSMRMLLAEQLLDDLLEALRAAKPSREVRRAMRLLQQWDQTVEAESRGGLLFGQWYARYADLMQGRELYAVPWSFEHPMSTPDGLSDEQKAVAAFEQALQELKEQYGGWDLAWGAVHRLRHGELDLPISGGPGGLGCFRVLWFRETEDGKRAVRGGDGWQLAVEFSDPPRAYSILAYGQSNDPNSPHHTDQVGLFARNEMKRVAFTEEEIAASLIRAYRPGE
ncbi:MAG: penicillin acylase family protein [Bacteroidetes bacterium]|nr:MAG: penicillin acylase family protein [Bacteroidota bacterium]